MSPDTFLSAAPAPAADYAAPAADHPDPAAERPWPVTSTGPMYVWNPAAVTAPLSIAAADEAERNGDAEDEDEA
ncbi:MAG TPA: hypothetical protein VGD91_29430 [Trebonia sp.]